MQKTNSCDLKFFRIDKVKINLKFRNTKIKKIYVREKKLTLKNLKSIWNLILIRKKSLSQKCLKAKLSVMHGTANYNFSCYHEQKVSFLTKDIYENYQFISFLPSDFNFPFIIIFSLASLLSHFWDDVY